MSSKWVTCCPYGQNSSSSKLSFCYEFAFSSERPTGEGG